MDIIVLFRWPIFVPFILPFTIAFKGYAYEKRVLTDLRNNQVDALSLAVNEKGEMFQCDVAFVLGRDLFLCECKHVSQPLTPQKRFNFYNLKIPADVDQINRVCDYYEEHLDAVAKELNSRFGERYPLSWRPRAVYRLLIYSCKLAHKLDVSGVMVTDYAIFNALIERKLPALLRGGEPVRLFMPPSAQGLFVGKLTTNKLMTAISQPWQIAIPQTFMEVKDEIVPINSFDLCYRRPVRKMDHFHSI